METKNILSRDDFLALNNDYNAYVKKCSKRCTIEILISVAIAILVVIVIPSIFEIDLFVGPIVVSIVATAVFLVGTISACSKRDKKTREYANTLYTEYLKQNDAL